MIQLNVTYGIVTPESAEIGDYAEHGFEHEDMEFSNLEDCIRFIESNYGYLERGNDTDFYTIDAERDMYDGSEKTYGIHFDSVEDANRFWVAYRCK